MMKLCQIEYKICDEKMLPKTPKKNEPNEQYWTRGGCTRSIVADRTTAAMQRPIAAKLNRRVSKRLQRFYSKIIGEEALTATYFGLS